MQQIRFTGSIWKIKKKLMSKHGLKEAQVSAATRFRDDFCYLVCGWLYPELVQTHKHIDGLEEFALRHYWLL